MFGIWQFWPTEEIGFFLLAVKHHNETSVLFDIIAAQKKIAELLAIHSLHLGQSIMLLTLCKTRTLTKLRQTL